MVWSVCRQALRRQQDAEDAFQATFLLLVRHAGSIRTSESAAGWLYRVAYRTSIRARKKLASRREEALALDPHAPAEVPFPDLEGRQTAAALIEELMQLPKKYQTPLVLRYLEGHSRRAIADQTDTTVPTVQGRLARGKQMLRRRLVRRGVSLSAAMAVLTGRPSTAGAAAPSQLLLQTSSNAGAVAAGGSLAASTAVVTLYQEGVRAMLAAWIAKPVGVIAAVAVATLMATAADQPGQAGAPSSGALMLEAGVAAEPAPSQGEVQLAQLLPDHTRTESRRRKSSEQPAAQAAPPTRVGGSPAVPMPPSGTITGFVRTANDGPTTEFVETASKPAHWPVRGDWVQSEASAMQYGDMGLNGRKLSDAEQSDFLLKQWAQAATAKDPPPADGKPSAKELHTWHTYWDSRYHALRNQFEQMTRKLPARPGRGQHRRGSGRDGRRPNSIAAEVFKARAEALRYERELKQRALAEEPNLEQSQGPNDANARVC